MDSVGVQRQVFLLCGSWYSKGRAAALVNAFSSLDIICNAGIDTVMYGLPPDRTGKRGRPKKYGERLSPGDIGPASPKTRAWRPGVSPVLTRLWGGRAVYAIVALPKSGDGGPRLFFCTKDPEDIVPDHNRCADDVIRGYGKEDIRYLPLAFYYAPLGYRDILL